jgi:hypothetical protein
MIKLKWQKDPETKEKYHEVIEIPSGDT